MRVPVLIPHLLFVLLAVTPSHGRDLAPRRVEVPAAKRPVVKFTERHPLSNLDEISARTEFNPKAEPNLRSDYDLADEAFELVVPRGYRRGVPHGLFVFLPPSEAPAPEGWLRELARRRLIWASPRNAGNDRGWPIKLQLALDTVHNVKQRYDIDPARVYIAGYSGGGSMASILIRGYPEVFTGAYCMLGYSFTGTRELESGRVESTLFLRPWHGQLERRKKEVCLVLMDGEGDPTCRPGAARAEAEGLRLSGFERVHWIEVPKLGHRPPNAAWFAKGLDLLESEPKPLPTTRPTAEANPGPGQVAQARRILASALSSMETAKKRGIPPGPAGRQYLRQVINEYPTTPAAAEARGILENLGEQGTAAPATSENH